MILVGTQPQIVVVHPSLPGTLKEFLQYAKANPGKVNFGSSGVGGSSHLSMEYFKMVAGINIVHVPYKGSAPASTAILAGEIQLGAFAANADAAAHQVREAARARGDFGASDRRFFRSCRPLPRPGCPATKWSRGAASSRRRPRPPRS